MPNARVTRPQATVTPAVPPTTQPPASETFRERAWRLLDERAATTDSHDTTAMEVSTRPATREQPPRPDNYIDAVLYLTLKNTLEVIFVLGWGEFVIQYKFNELDDRMSKIEKGQTITKTAEETSVGLDRKMSMNAKLIGKFITQKVAVAMAKKSKEYENKIKN